jgi:predicted DnaQ family exonuclease/DinG family helicase
LKLSLDTFICLDLETTGLDPAIDQITEIGAAKYVRGEKAGTFSSLVNPGMPIPPAVVELTAIDDDMVSSAPSIEVAIAELEKFLGDFPLIVGQNVQFDIAFLKKYLSLKFLTIIDSYFVDTAALARSIWPGLPGYGLSSLAKFLEIKFPTRHRALPDAEITSEVYLHELAAIGEFPKNASNFLAGLLFGETARGAVLASIENLPDTLPAPPDYSYDYGDNIIGTKTIERRDDFTSIDIDEVNELFDVRFRKLIDDYEERPQQLEMAARVAEAFNRSEILLAEAPPGIGKSLAYLAPALKWACSNGESVIISTQTKNLQDQLFNKDIPLVKDAFGDDFKAVLLKGRGNYVCLLKYYELVNEAVKSYGTEERQALMALVIWIETTRTGDIIECTGFNPGRHRYLWSRISCEGSFCLGRACAYYKRCFLFRVKSEALTAHLRVINHHLLLADFASGGDLVQTSGLAILDEAHNLEKVAAAYLGPEANHSRFIMLFNQIFTIRPVETGFLALVKMGAARLESADYKKLNVKIRQVQKMLAAARSDISGFFDKLSSSAMNLLEGKNETKEIRYHKLTDFIDQELIEQAALSIKKLQQALMNFGEDIEYFDDLKDKSHLAARCRALAEDLAELRGNFEFLVYPSEKDYVYWLEFWRKREVKLVSSPLEVGEILDKNFYDHLKTLILCSATLSVAGDFSFYRKRLGLDLASRERTMDLALDSPFDLENKVGFFEAGYILSPNSKAFSRQAALTIKELFAASDVKGMVLFTSYKSIIAVVSDIGSQLIDHGYELFVQDSNLSPFQLLGRYRRSLKGIIFGTDSFWEGVDLPGEDLELLIIAKLPFSVPDRPWIKANLEKIEREGGNPFMEFSLPEAVIKFRQGFGRLIRKKTDHGCVVVLDSRLSGKQYGRYFSQSVRPALQHCQSPAELIAGAKKYLA